MSGCSGDNDGNGGGDDDDGDNGDDDGNDSDDGVVIPLVEVKFFLIL